MPAGVRGAGLGFVRRGRVVSALLAGYYGAGSMAKESQAFRGGRKNGGCEVSFAVMLIIIVSCFTGLLLLVANAVRSGNGGGL